jgi:octopine/nopaline transport system substrate-binding protein
MSAMGLGRFTAAVGAVAAMLLLAGCGEGDKRAETAAAGADKPLPSPVRVATEGAYPPYNMLDPAGNLIGYDIDVMREICARAKIECAITAQAWDGIIPGLQAGKYDAIIAGMSITEERRRAVDFTQSYATTPAYFVALEGSPLHRLSLGLERIGLDEIDTTEAAAIAALKEALRGKSVGVQNATIHANFVDDTLGGAVSIRRYDTQDNLALDLAAGRIDVGLADSTAWEAFLDSEAGRNAGFVGPGFDGGPFGAGLGIAVRKGEARLLETLDGALTAMREDGTLKRIAEQWFGFDASAK